MERDSVQRIDQGVYLIRSDEGQYWTGADWVNDIRKAEAYHTSRDVYYALLLMRSDETRAIANIISSLSVCQTISGNGPS